MQTFTFNDAHSLAIRLWHWTFVLFMSATLVTVLLASTTYRTRNNIPMVQQQLQHQGITVTSDQARAVAHAFNDKLWDIHRLVGYILGILLLSRLLIDIFVSREEKFAFRLRKAVGIKVSAGSLEADRRHYIAVRTTYLVFYLLFLVMVLTGLGLAFEDVPFFRQNRQSIKQIHSLLQYFFYAFIFLHIVGVVRADMGRSKGLVSGMIHGNK